MDAFSPDEVELFERLHPLEAEAFRTEQPLPAELDDMEVRARYRRWRQLYKELPWMEARGEQYVERLRAEGKLPPKPSCGESV